MNAVANGNPAFTLRANQRSPVVGSELTVETVVVANDDFVWVASEYPYRWFWRSTERSNMPIRSRPDVSNTLHGMNWSPRSVNATGADHVAPWSNDWLTITSEFVLAEYGSLGAGSWLFRMSDQTTARCAAFVGSAAMLPAAQLRKTLS